MKLYMNVCAGTATQKLGGHLFLPSVLFATNSRYRYREKSDCYPFITPSLTLIKKWHISNLSKTINFKLYKRPSKLRATTCICNGFHGAAATCTLPLHIAVAWAHSCIYFFCAHNIETNIEAQLKIKTPTCQNKQAAVPLPNCAGNFPCTSQVGIPSHSCFQSWQGKQSRKGNDVSLQDSISTRAKG